MDVYQNMISRQKEIFSEEEQEILRTTPKIKLADVCEKIGYNDTVKFIRDFKLQYGGTPAKYKQRFQIK